MLGNKGGWLLFPMRKYIRKVFKTQVTECMRNIYGKGVSGICKLGGILFVKRYR